VGARRRPLWIVVCVASFSLGCLVYTCHNDGDCGTTGYCRWDGLRDCPGDAGAFLGSSSSCKGYLTDPCPSCLCGASTILTCPAGCLPRPTTDGCRCICDYCPGAPNAM